MYRAVSLPLLRSPSAAAYELCHINKPASPLYLWVCKGDNLHLRLQRLDKDEVARQKMTHGSGKHLIKIHTQKMKASVCVF